MINILKYIHSPENIQTKDIAVIDSLLIEFPYYQTAQLLLSKGLLNTNSLLYNRQLKKTAAYALERKQLFNLITQNKTKKISLIKEKKNKDLMLGTPIKFEKEEKHSFSEWLTLSKIKKINRQPTPQQTDLINKFIHNKTTISKPKKGVFFKATDVAKEALIENSELITPTLAKVYLEQGHYKKAILAYKKLSLKYPEKNSFFANQIKLINKLNEK